MSGSEERLEFSGREGGGSGRLALPLPAQHTSPHRGNHDRTHLEQVSVRTPIRNRHLLNCIAERRHVKQGVHSQTRPTQGATRSHPPKNDLVLHQPPHPRLTTDSGRWTELAQPPSNDVRAELSAAIAQDRKVLGEVYPLLERGLSDQEIARELGISRRRAGRNDSPLSQRSLRPRRRALAKCCVLRQTRRPQIPGAASSISAGP